MSRLSPERAEQKATKRPSGENTGQWSRNEDTLIARGGPEVETIDIGVVARPSEHESVPRGHVAGARAPRPAISSRSAEVRPSASTRQRVLEPPTTLRITTVCRRGSMRTRHLAPTSE